MFAMLYARKTTDQASSYEHVCPLRDVSAIVRSAVWKPNNSKGSLKHHFMNTSAAA